MKARKYLRVSVFTIPLGWPALPGNWWAWLPSRGNVLFTLVVVAGLLWAGRAGALPLNEPAAPALFPSQLNYQGYVRDLDGTPLDGTYDMIFRLYCAAEGGDELWKEEWTQANNNNQVTVTEGLFNVALGRLKPIDASVFDCDTLYVGISIDGDPEASPREQLTMVPYAWSASTAQDADKLDGKDSTDFATAGHNHDDRYYTEGESNSRFAPTSHNHDGRYYTESESDSRYARTSHNHDGRYYTEGESNTRFVNASGDGMSGNLDMGSNQISNVTRVSSPGDTGLTIDAGLGSDRVLTLHDDVTIPNGDLDMGGNRIKNASQLEINGDIRIGGQTFVTGNFGDGFLQIPRKDFDPSNPVNGMIYYNNPANCLRIYAKGAWRNLQCW